MFQEIFLRLLRVQQQGKGSSFSLNWDKSEAEAEVVVAIAGAVVAPVRRTAVLREAVPTAATAHAVRV